MRSEKLSYKKNFTLIVLFMALISVSLVLALFLGYSFIRKYVENEFYSKKIEVLEETIAPYQNLFQKSIPEISFYQGYLDSASASKYADSILLKYPFVEKIIYYDAVINNHKIDDCLSIGSFSLGVKSIIQYKRGASKDSVLFSNTLP